MAEPLGVPPRESARGLAKTLPGVCFLFSPVFLFGVVLCELLLGVVTFFPGLVLNFTPDLLFSLLGLSLLIVLPGVPFGLL